MDMKIVWLWCDSQLRLEECNEVYELVKRNTKESSVG